MNRQPPQQPQHDQHGQQLQGQQTGAQGPQRTTARGAQSPEMQSQGTQPPLTHSFRDHLTDELRIALEDFSELSHIASWCAKECAAAGIGTCARICQDLAEIAALNEMLIARDSMFGPEVGDTFVRIARDALPQLRQYQRHHPHIIETIATLERTMNSCSTVLGMVGQGGQSSQGMAEQSGSRQPSGRQSGGQRSGGQHQHAGSRQFGGQESSGQQLSQQSSGQARHPRF